MADMPSSEKSASGPAAPRRLPFVLRPRPLRCIAAGLVAILLTTIALLQPYRESPVAPSFWTFDWWLNPIERNAFFRPSQPLSVPIAIAGNGGPLWIGSPRGDVASSADNGATWRIHKFAARINAIAFANRSVGFVAGTGRTIYATEDGGATWREVQIEGEGATIINAMAVRHDPLRLVAAGAYGEVVTGGMGKSFTARKRKVPDAASLRGLFWDESGKVWFVGDNEQLYEAPLRDGEGQLERIDISRPGLDRRDTFIAIGLFSRKETGRGFALGYNSAWTTRNGGRNWEVLNQISGRPARANAIAVANDSLGYMVGAGGMILATVDGGENWSAQSSGTTETLLNAAFDGPQRGWVIGTNATLLRTENGGDTWVRVDTQHRAYPAPWFYVGLVVLCAYVAFVMWRRSADIQRRIDEIVTDRLVTDRPLRPGDFDALDFGQIARGISRFLRNEKTEPPLTIAITGEWGSGKSSIMSLLQDDLVKHRCRCIWFNAWHHQKEEHLLASLIDAVRRNTTPKPWSIEGLRVRLRLLAKRVMRSPLHSLALAAVFLFCLAFVLRSPTSFGDFLAAVGALFEKTPAPAWPQNAIRWGAPPTLREAFDLGASVLAVLVAVLMIAAKARDGLAKIGLDPAKLVAAASGQGDAGALKNSLSFRHHFAAEFRDATEVLRPSRLVVIIDDIDRCKPENVTDVLEAVNFLASSGDCFLVMGMARQHVELSVGLSFEKVANELGAAAGAPTAEEREEAAKAKRRDYARRYIEKLINLEVPVPVAGTEAKGRIFARRDPDATPAGLLARLKSVSAATWLRAVLPPLLLAAVFYFGWRTADEYDRLSGAKTPAAAVPAAPAAPASPPAGTIPGPTTAPRTDTGQGPPRPGQGPPAPSEQGTAPAAGFAPGDARPWIGALALAAFGAVIGLFWAIERRRRVEVVVRDSADFVGALAAWQNVIGLAHETPRGVKRFMNRLRYFAMRLRPEAAAAGATAPTDAASSATPRPAKGILSRLFGPVPPPAPPPDMPLREESLVAVAVAQEALFRIDRSADRLDSVFANAAFETVPPERRGSALETALREALGAHRAKFRALPTMDEIAEFRRIEPTVRMY